MENDHRIKLPQEDNRFSPALQRAIKREGLGYLVDALSDAQIEELEKAIVMDHVIHDDPDAHHFFDRLVKDYAEELQQKADKVTPHSWAKRIEDERDEHSHIHVGHTAA